MTTYPTCEHRVAAETVTERLSQWPEVETILLTCSCARGKAGRDSCLDIEVLVRPEVFATEKEALEKRWKKLDAAEPVFERMRKVAAFSGVDLDFSDGCFKPGYHGWTSGPDNFELEIGNTVAHVVPLFERGDYFEQLRDQWLPYYDEDLRRERLAMVREFCVNNLDHIAYYVDRGLHFQGFDRLYKAFGEFLQALFISRRTYPIAYDKWVREQVEDILGLPDLYRELPALFEIRRFESREMAEKGETLRRLLERYVGLADNEPGTCHE